MNRIRAVLIGAAAVAAVGCIQGEREIRVEADGSGRIEDSVKLVGEFAEMMQGFEEMDGEKTEEQKLAEKEEQARAAGAKMGPGVSLVSFEVGEDGSQKTVYAFEDISKLSIADTPTPPGADEEEGEGEDGDDEVYTFRFEAGGEASTLVLVAPASDGGGGEAPAEAPSEEEKQQMVGMFKGMFEGARIRTTLTVGGEILETNTPHREGSTITVLEVDFEKLLADQESVEAMATSPDRPDRAMLAGVTGVTLFSEPELTVRFKK